MTALCTEQHIELLAHGTLLGGLLSDYWLRRRDPGVDSLATAAEKKYYPEVLAWGGGRLTHWKQHQALLEHCREVADKHSVSVSAATASFTLAYGCSGITCAVVTAQCLAFDVQRVSTYIVASCHSSVCRYE
jgi:aryl-alcohol dehydrogenase-like predicted oxidoreductase